MSQPEKKPQKTNAQPAVNNSGPLDPMIEASFVSDALQGTHIASTILDELQRRFTMVGRLQDSLSTCKNRIGQLEARNQKIEEFMNAHVTNEGLGGNLDTTR
jgi:predicted nucleotide-binding protein